MALLSPSHAARTVRVGIYENPPKIFHDATGRASGIQIDLLREIAAAESWQLEFISCQWQDCLDRITAGQLDLLPDVAHTEARGLQFDFHHTPALHSWSQIYRRADVSIQSLLDLDGRRIAMLAGSVQESALRQMLAGFDVNFEIVLASTPDEAFALAESGQVDAAIASHHFGNYRAEDFRLIETPIMMLPAKLFFVTTRGRNDDMLTAIDAHLAPWQATPDSPYFVIMKKWLDQQPATLIPPILRTALLVLFVLGAMLTAGILVLRSQVRERTAQLQRLNRLYATLSQCNQAIVRCNNQSELLERICRDVVGAGEIKMIWIGMIDDATRTLTSVAAAGDGIEYLQDLHIALDADGPTSRGPSGIAISEDRPYWCQDFSTDPATLPWQETGKRFGWQASAALPLHLAGQVIGVMNLYADRPGAFDDAAQSLMHEMAQDIDHALERFRLNQLREQMADTLQESEEKYRELTESINDVIWTLDPVTLRFLYVSPSVERLRGYTAEEIMAEPMDAALTPESAAKVRALLDAHLVDFEAGRRTPEDHTLTEVEQPRRDGSTVWTEVMTNMVRNRRTGRIEIHGVTRDISERKRAEARIEHLAHFDQLTGLPNRSQLKDRFQFALNLEQRRDGRLATLFIDLDHFKDINDSLGHDIGDRLLIDVAHRLTSILRAGDTLSRLGGDEFILLLPDIDADGAARVASKLLEHVAQPLLIDQHELVVTPSIGIAMYPEDGHDMDTLMRNADAAMYQVKRDSRNGFRFFTREMQAHSVRTLTLANALRTAQERGQLSLMYQPQLCLHTGQVIGAEALLRWHHPQLGMVPPAEFIPIAESTGLIVDIGHWVMCEAAAQASRWRRDGLPPLSIAVNLSAVQFRNPRLSDRVAQVLDEAGLPAEALELELTEATTMEDPQKAVLIIDQLSARGIAMSIDDFGTGHSSLSYLKRFRVGRLKIDRSFVRDITEDAEDKAIVAAIIQLANNLGMTTIAEGVETAGQLDFLREQGCDAAQGYFFSRPLSASDFERYLSATLMR